jgi:hypothetical protein
MEYTLKTDLTIGQTLYYLKAMRKNVYAPCTVCNNARKVSITVNGEDFKIDCPKCTGERTKGDTHKFIKSVNYSVEECTVREFIYGKDNRWRVTTSEHSNVDPVTLIGTRYTEKTEIFTDRESAKKRMKELNKIEREKSNEFLKAYILQGGE